METFVVHPDEIQSKALRAFLKALEVPFEVQEEVLPQHVIDGIKQGQEDIRQGRSISLQEFKQRLAAG